MSQAQRVFVFGDSHAQPLVEAVARWSFSDRSGDDSLFPSYVDCGLIAHELTIETRDQGDMLNPILQREMDRGGLYNRWTYAFSPENAHVGLLFGYVEVHMLGFTAPVFEGFDAGLLRDGPRSASGATHYAMLRELLRRRLRKIDKTVGLLKRAGFDVFLMSSPPPSTDAAIAEHQLADERAPAGARLAVWRAISDVMAESAQRHGARLLTDQSRFTDADGFLLPEYVGDGIHANADYGRAYLTDICEALGLAWTPTPRGAVESAPEETAPAEETAALEQKPAPEIERIGLAELPREPAQDRGWRAPWRRR